MTSSTIAVEPRLDANHLASPDHPDFRFHGRPRLRVNCDAGGDRSRISTIRAIYITSLASGITDYIIENSRRYHAYKEETCLYPHDEVLPSSSSERGYLVVAHEKEKDRRDIMLKPVEVSLKGKTNLAPISKKPQRILDLGTGTGIWALEIDDIYPHAEMNVQNLPWSFTRNMD